MKYLFITILSFIIIIACNYNKTSSSNPTSTSSSKKYIQVNFKVNLNIPNIGITNYTLITNNLQKDSSNAQAIIRAKVILPLAMLRRDYSLFDSTLAKDFISQSEEEFFTRNEYIQNRINGKWMSFDVQYENLVLEFFGNFAILTYRNRVKEKDEFGKENSFLWFWTDIWINENGSWKIRVLRAIN